MHRSIFPAACAALLTMAVYLGTLDASFVYDDGVYIENNPQIQSPGNLFFTPFPEYMGPMRGLYRPMTTASLALDYQIFGMEPWGFHLTNILLHGLCTLVCFYLFRRFMEGHWGPFAGALLFGLHPVHAEAVAWAVGRSELLAGLGCLASLLFYFWARPSLFTLRNKAGPHGAKVEESGGKSPLMAPNTALYLSLAAFAFAALSKESALAFPGILAACELFLFRTDSWKKKVLKISPFVVVLVLILAARYAVLGTLSPEEGERVLPHVAYPERLKLSCWVLSRYVELTLYPLGLTAHYRPLAFFESSLGAALVPALLFLAAALLAAFRARPFAFAAALFLMPLVPVLNLVPIGEVVSERFLYLPLAGAGLALALAVSRLSANRAACQSANRAASLAANRAAWAALAALGLTLAFLTVRQAEVWTDSYTLWQNAVEADPEDPQAHFGLGIAMMERGMYTSEPGPLSQFNKVRSLNPSYKEDQVFTYFGKLYQALGRPEDAFREYQQALLRFPFHLPALKGILNMEKVRIEAGMEGRLSKQQRKGLVLQLLKALPDESRQEALRSTYQDFLE